MDAPHPLTLDRFAELSARIEAGTPPAEVLASAEVSPEAWELTQETWLGRMGAQAAQGKLGLQRRYAELFALHQKKARAELRAVKRKLTGPMPLSPVARVSSLAVGPLGKKDEERPELQIPTPVLQVGGATADLGAVVQMVLAGKAATPFAAGKGGKAAAPPAVAPPRPPPPPPPPVVAAPPPEAVKPAAPRPGGETADISSIVAQVLAGKAATPFAGAAKAPEAPKPAPPAASKIGGETADISSVVQQVLAAQRATPFAGAAKAPEAPKPAPPPDRDQAPPSQAAPHSQPLPFRAAAPSSAAAPQGPAAAPALPPNLPNLTLEQYAELRIQLLVQPARTAEILALWGVHDAPSWAALQWVWQHRMSRDPALTQRWTQIVAELKAARGIR